MFHWFIVFVGHLRFTKLEIWTEREVFWPENVRSHLLHLN